MMSKMVCRRILLVFLLGLPLSTLPATTGTEVLPIEIQVDLLIDELSMKREAGDAEGVIEVIAKVRELDAPFPNFLYWVEAQALYDTGQLLEARDRILAYLKLAGKEGRFYEQASSMLVGMAPEVEKLEKELEETRRQREKQLAEAERKAQMLRTQNAQRLLDQLGFPVQITGELDKQTIEAVAVFQVRRDLDINGRITDEVLDTLMASVPDTHLCDRLAHYSRSADDWTTVSFAQMDATLAISECNAALRDYPDVVRFNIQYARALAAAGRSDEALYAAGDLARKGYPAAEYLIAELHIRGSLHETGKPDHANAMRLYQIAAERGYARAQHRMGLIYEEGNRVAPRSYSQAMSWYLKAAEQGYAPSQLKAAAWYDMGRGVDRSYSTALEWYKRAANSGVAEAEYQIGYYYERGRGVQRSRPTAVTWYEKAAARGHQGAADKVRRLKR